MSAPARLLIMFFTSVINIEPAFGPDSAKNGRSIRKGSPIARLACIWSFLRSSSPLVYTLPNADGFADCLGFHPGQLCRIRRHFRFLCSSPATICSKPLDLAPGKLKTPSKISFRFCHPRVFPRFPVALLRGGLLLLQNAEKAKNPLTNSVCML